MLFLLPTCQRPEQIVFRDLVPALGNGGTILLYILLTMAGAALIHLIWDRIVKAKAG